MFEILFTNADGARVKLARAATPLGVQRAAGVGRCLHHGVVASARCRFSEWLAAIVLLLFSEDSLFNLKIYIDWPIKIEHSERQFHDGKIIRDAQIFLTV